MILLIIGSVSAIDSDDVMSSDDSSDLVASDSLEDDSSNIVTADNSKENVLSDAEAEVDGSNFASLDSAIQNVDAGGTVHLNTNVSLNDGTSGEETTYANGITISKDVTINGYDQTINATDANGNKVRLFTINSGAHVTLKDLTIAGASYSGGDNNVAAAITVAGSSYLTLINVNFVDNYAQMTARLKICSAALMVTGGSTVNITGGSFINNTLRHDAAPNTAGGGAAIDVNKGTLYVNGTLFENNVVNLADVSNAAGGAAISSLNSPISIANSRFINNRVILEKANAKGGALYIIPNSGLCDIINNTFINNHAYSAGAMYAQSTNINVQSCIFENNTATDSVIATFWNGGNFTHNVFGEGQKVYKNDYVTVGNNWWGNNEPTDVGTTLTSWIVMKLEHDDNHVIIKLTKLNDGTTLDNPEALPVMEATVTGLGETKKVKIINGVGTLTLDGPITDFAGNTVTATLNGQSLSFVVNDDVKSFAQLESNIQNTTNGGTYDVKGNFQLNTGVTGEEITYAQGIVIDKNITIDGHGLTINATDVNGNKVRIFNIKNGAIVTLKDIILTGASAINGGAIIVDDATLILNGVTFTGNTATNGGAVFSDNGNVNAINSTFVNNTATNAGAIQIANGMIECCVFKDNSASQGSAVILTTASASANYNMFLDNQTVSGLGNFDYNWWGNNAPENVGVTLNNWLVLTVSNNDTLISVGLNTLNTGANVPNPEKLSLIPIELSWEGSVNELNLNDGAVTIEFNKPVTYDSAYVVTAKLYDFELNYTLKPITSDYNNFAQLNNSISTAQNSKLDLDNDYKLNEVNVNEETIYKDGIVISNDITIDGKGHTINATDSNGNKAMIFNINNANVTLKNIVLTGSSASALGGAIYINGGSLTLINVTFIDNHFTISSGSTTGGAALTANNAKVTITNSSFINNVLTKTVQNLVAGGGAIYLNGGSLDVDNSLFDSNVYSAATYSNNAAGGGGAIYTTTATTNIKNSRFLKNSATRTSGNGAVTGGALLIKTGTLTGNIFEGNTATSAPNAVSVTDATGIVNYNAFVGATAQTVGGSADYQANWWGTNNPSSVGVTLTNWLVLNHVIEGNNISATINTLNTGDLVESTELLPVREANITLDGFSSIINTTNGKATARLDKEIVIGTSYDGSVNIDDQTLTFTIKPSITNMSIDSVVNASIGVDGQITVSLVGIEGVTPTGTVSLWLNSILYTIELENGTGSINLGHDLDGGVYNIYIKYLGDVNYTETDKVKSNFTFSVAKLTPTISVNDNKTYYGVGTYIWVEVSGDSLTPTGVVTLSLNGNEVTKELTNGKTFIPVSADLDIGTHELIIKYSGDNKFNALNESITLNVTKFDVNMTYDLSRDIFAEGINGTINVTVTPEGIVYYYDEPLYSFDETSSSKLSQIIKVTDASYAYASYLASLSIVSNGLKITSSTSSSSLNKNNLAIFPQAGSYFEFEFVSSTNFRLYLLTGKTFASNIGYLSYSSSAYKFWPKSGSSSTFDGFAAPKEGDIFKVKVENKRATFLVNDQVIGSISVSNNELYYGFYTYRGSTTIVNNIVVDLLGKEPTETTYVPSTAPTGSVIVKIGNNITKNVTIENGKISLDIGENLTEGTYDLEFIYSGDSIYNGASSTGLLKVKKYLNPTISIDVPEACELGKNITVSVNVTGSGDPITGEVTVTVGDIVKKFNAENGTFTFNVGETLSAGNHTINVYYDGDDNYFMGTNNTSFLINKVNTTVNATGGVTVLVGNDAIIYVTVDPVNGIIPTGSVTIISTNVNKTVNLDSTGTATCNIGADLPSGVHDVYVEYNGDVNFNKANTTVYSMYAIVDTIYVDSELGSDENGTGFADKPFKSIRKAWATLNGNGTIVLTGLFTGSDNIGLTLSKSKMMNIDIVGNGAVIDAQMTRASMFTINKANVRFINLTLNNCVASTDTYGSLINVVDADSLAIINSTITNIYEQNGKGGAIYLQDYDVSLSIINSKFDNLVSYHSGLISTNSVNQGLSNAHNKIYITNSTFTNLLAYQNILVSSSNGFGAGADVVIENSVFSNTKGTDATYSSFIQSNSLNMTNCVLSDLDFNSRWTWISIKEGNLDYNFWSSNDPDFSHLSIRPTYWILMTFDNESDVFTATLNTLNDGSTYTNLTTDVIFSDNLNPSVVRLDENGTASGILYRQLKVGEKVSATVGSLTLSLLFKQDIEGISPEVTNAARWENGTINITVEGRDDVFPTGNVTIWVNNVPYTVNLTDGYAVLEVGEDLAVGNYISKVQYNGDENYFASDVTEFIFGVDKANVNISTVVDSIEYGQNQTIEFNLSSDIATGNFTFAFNNNEYIVYVNDSKIDLGILNAGEYSFIVTYNGDENYNVASTEVSFNVTKKQIAPTVEYADAIKVGQNQTVEVIFDEFDENAVVSLEFNGNIKLQSISGNKAVFEITGLKEGNYSFTITYEGTNYVADPVSRLFNVTKSSLDISAYAVNASAGNNISIIISGIPDDATGIVIVSVDGTNYGAKQVDGNYVAIIPALKVGNNTAYISFNGDDMYSSASTSAAFTVSPLNITVNVNVDGEITKDSTIDILAPNATGELIVIVDDELKTVPIVDGNASFSLENVSYGDHNIVVIYNGVVAYVSEFAIEKLNATISASADPVYVGNDVKVIVTINSTANGSVIIDDKYYGEINAGEAIIYIPNLDVGNYTFTVKYSGDDVFNESEVTVDVSVLEFNKTDANISVSADPIYVGDVAQVVVTVNPNAKGSIVIDDKYYAEINAGEAIIDIPNLASGTHVFTVKYSGDDVFEKSQTSVEVIVNKYDSTPVISVESIQLGDDAYIEVTLPDGATGNVTIYIDGENPVTLVLEQSKVSTYISDLPIGNHTVKAVYSGDGKYLASNSTGEFEVAFDIEIEEDIAYGEEGTIELTLPADATGNVTVIIDGNEYVADVEDGSAIVELPELSYGDHDATIIYSGDDKYPTKVINKTISVGANIEIPQETTYGGDDEISITLPSDASGNLTVVVNGEETVIPVVNGTASFSLKDLNPGENNISVAYSGDGKYDPVAAEEVTVNVAPDISLPDEMGTTDNNIGINLPSDASGNLTVTVDGVPTTIPVVNGTANMVVSNLSAGEHTIDVAYSGDGKYPSFNKSSTVSVSRVLPSSSASVPESIDAGKAITIPILFPDDATGIVLVDVDGNKYYATVENGVANVSVAGLSAGEKLLTYEYLGDDKYAPFAQDVTLTVKNATKLVYQKSKTVLLTAVKKGSYYKITLKDANGKVLAGKNIKVVFNGVTKTLKTDKNGVVNFKLAAKKVGNYKLTMNFAGDSQYAASKATATIKITKEATKLAAVKKGEKYTITLKDSRGKALAKKAVYIKFDGKTKKYTTNKKGVISYKPVVTKAGTQKITIKFNGDSDYAAATKTVTMKVNKVVTKLTAKNKKFKKSKKVKKYKVTLKDNKGKAVKNAKVTLKIKKKVFKATTNAKGKAVFKIKKLNKKGKYAAKVNFAGDKLYKKVAKSVKIVVKK